MKRKLFLLSGALLGVLAALGLAWVLCPNLPTDPVAVSHQYPGANSFFNISFTGIPTGYDVQNSPVIYTGWCIEDNRRSNTTPATLYCSYDLSLPGNMGSVPWDRVNYLLNHKMAGATWQEVQAALWVIVFGASNMFPVTPNAQAMIADAAANGGGFMPAVGQVVAVILYTGDGGIGPDGFQDTIIEMLIPGQGEGCTPGYWRNHFEDWPATGYSTGQDFDTVFGTDYFSPNITLGQAIWRGGGGVNKIARHGTAALLSAAHPDVDYPYTVAQVISMVQSGGGNIDLLVDANELGCNIPHIR
jgi:hypothetical protein